MLLHGSGWSHMPCRHVVGGCFGSRHQCDCMVVDLSLSKIEWLHLHMEESV